MNDITPTIFQIDERNININDCGRKQFADVAIAYEQTSQRVIGKGHLVTSHHIQIGTKHANEDSSSGC